MICSLIEQSENHSRAMAFWRFKKRSGEESKQESTTGPEPSTKSRISSSQAGTVMSRKLSKRGRKRRDTSSSRQDSYSQVKQLEAIVPLSPMNSSFVRPNTSASQGSVENITALPRSRQVRTSPHLRPATRNDADIPYDFRLYSSSRLHTPNHQVMENRPESRTRNKLSRSPTKRRPFPTSNLPLKLTKKPPKDSKLVREEDFRAMSAPTAMPRQSGRGDTGILRRDDKKMRDGLNRNFERPLSNISLPRPDSSRYSTRSAVVDGRSYRISVLDVLSPRPIIRAQDQPYSMLTVGWSAPPSRSNSGRRGVLSSGKQSFRPSNLKRVEDLADDMDSTDLRAIMDRDKQRKERKKERENERLQRRLERRAERERLKEEAALDDGDAPAQQSRDAEAGISQDEPQLEEGATRKKSHRKHKRDKAKAADVPLATETEALAQDDIIAGGSTLPQHQQKDTTTSPKLDRSPSLPAPLTEPVGPGEMGDVDAYEPALPSTPKRTQSVTGEGTLETSGNRLSIPQFPAFGSSGSDADESPVTSPHSPNYPLHNALSPHLAVPTTTTQQSQALPLSATPSITALPVVPASPERKKRRPSILLSFFRRGDKRKSRAKSSSETDNATEPESGTSFVNLSRNQMRSELEPIPGSRAGAQTGLTIPSGRTETPHRSRSKFHEDLPDAQVHRPRNIRPPSPPSSRVNSPMPQLTPTSPEFTRAAMITPISHHRTSEQSALSPDAHDHDTEKGNKSPVRQANPFTRSLASIDSEGSWLTGKPVNRGLSNRSGVRSPGSNRETNSQRNSNSHAESTSDDGTETVAQDDYFRRLSPGEEAHIDENLYKKPNFTSQASSVLGTKASSEAIGTITSQGGFSDSVEAQREKKEGQLKVHGDLAKHPDIKKGLSVRSSEGLLKEMLNTKDKEGAGEYEIDSEDDNPAVKTVDIRHDSSMPNIRDLALEVDSDDSDAPALYRAKSVKTGKFLDTDARVVNVSKRSSHETVSGTASPRVV